jgi:hypothetical protein
VAGALGAVAMALAAGWALFLPIFLSPDEDSHYDYALTLYSAGRCGRPKISWGATRIPWSRT